MRTMSRRILAIALALCAGCASEPGADLEPGAVSLPGKADGASDIVFTTAEEVARLAYRDGEERSSDEAQYVFAELVSPPSALIGRR